MLGESSTRRRKLNTSDVSDNFVGNMLVKRQCTRRKKTPPTPLGTRSRPVGLKQVFLKQNAKKLAVFEKGLWPRETDNNRVFAIVGLNLNEEKKRNMLSSEVVRQNAVKWPDGPMLGTAEWTGQQHCASAPWLPWIASTKSTGCPREKIPWCATQRKHQLVTSGFSSISNWLHL